MGKRILKIVGFALIFFLGMGRLVSAQESAESLPSVVNLSLLEAVDRTLFYYEKMKVSESSVEEAKGEKWQSYNLALPSLSGNYTYTRNVSKSKIFFESGSLTVGFDNIMDLNANFTQPLFGFGRIKHGILSARRDYDASVFANLQTRADVIFEARQAYYGVLLGRDRVKVARTSLDQAKETLRRQQGRYRVGEVPEFDFNRASLDVEIKQSEFIQEEGDFQIAFHKLKRLTGFLLEQEIQLSDSLTQFVRPIPETMAWESFVNSNPTVKSLAKNAESAASPEHARKAARGGFFPYLNYFTSYQGEGQSSQNFIPQASDFSHAVSLGLNVQVPVFDGMLTAGKYKSAEAQSVKAAWQKLLTEKDLKLNLEQALTLAKTNQIKKDTEYRSLALADTLYSQAKLRFENGLISFIDLKDVRNSLEQTRLQYLNSLYDYVLSLAKIDQIVGVKLDQP
jgi:outer membrane protein TolC